MNDNHPTERDGRLGRSLLRRADQACVAALLAVSLAVTAAWWFYHGGHRGQLIEIDRAEPRDVRFVVDLNAAEWPELANLPDIGETLARRIVQSRDANGPFVDFDDLQRVNGIGPKTVDRLRPYLLPIPDANNLVGH